MQISGSLDTKGEITKAGNVEFTLRIQKASFVTKLLYYCTTENFKTLI